VLNSLLKLGARYAAVESGAALAVAERLTTCQPLDLAGLSLRDYKGLKHEWHDWNRVREICSGFGKQLGEALILRGAT
jgi:hypothetical protein